jgi:endo-1,4-beta-xylanase
MNHLRTAATLLCLTVACRASAAAPPTLRDAVAGRFLIGTAVMSSALEDPTMAGLVARQFDALTGENEFKPASLQPRPGRFRFAEADRLADFAAAHGMRMVGHTLCWHQQTPAWFYEDAEHRPLARAVALAHLHDHIVAVMGHFRGRVIGWDVVNEALSDGPGPDLRDTPARRAIGDDYVAQAFAFARAADPSAELYYNDYNIEQPPKRDRALRLIRDLTARGLRIDAVGIQGHWSLDRPDARVIDEAISAFAATGVRVSITELDVDVLPRPAKWGGQSQREATTTPVPDPYRGGCPPAVLQLQSARYAGLFRLCLHHGHTVERVTLWGVGDGQSWLNDFPFRGRTNYPLLFDRHLSPKPAFTAVVDALR